MASASQYNSSLRESSVDMSNLKIINSKIDGSIINARREEIDKEKVVIIKDVQVINVISLNIFSLVATFATLSNLTIKHTSFLTAVKIKDSNVSIEDLHISERAALRGDNFLIGESSTVELKNSTFIINKTSGVMSDAISLVDTELILNSVTFEVFFKDQTFGSIFSSQFKKKIP